MLALMLFGFALAQPQCGSHSELTKRRGIDVVVAPRRVEVDVRA